MCILRTTRVPNHSAEGSSALALAPLEAVDALRVAEMILSKKKKEPLASNNESCSSLHMQATPAALQNISSSGFSHPSRCSYKLIASTLSTRLRKFLETTTLWILIRDELRRLHFNQRQPTRSNPAPAQGVSMMLKTGLELCECFPCLLFYLGRYINPRKPYQVSRLLKHRGFTSEERVEIAAAWEEANIDLECTILDFVKQDRQSVARDYGCIWHRPRKRFWLEKKAVKRPDVLPAQWARLAGVIGAVLEDIEEHHASTKEGKPGLLMFPEP